MSIRTLRLRLVQQREESRPLNDPALADPYFGDCRSRRRLLTDVSSIDRATLAALVPEGARGCVSGHERAPSQRGSRAASR